jgi:hypothetical protein
VVRPRSCRVIYYFDTPALGRRHQYFGRVNCDELILCEKGKYMKKKKSPPNFIVTKNPNWSSEILGKGLII